MNEEARLELERIKEELDNNPQTLKVGNKTEPKKLGGAIAGELEKFGICKLRAIGAGSVNQTDKGIAVTKIYLEEKNILPVVSHDFITIDIDGHEKTGIHYTVYGVDKDKFMELIK